MNIKIILEATYTANRGNISRRWQELEIPETGFKFWKWQEDFGDKEGLTLKCEDEQGVDDDEWFVPDSQASIDKRITSEVITSLLANGRYRLK